ncbi:putative HMP/thiamine import ATP-binding protein YkoD [Methanobrevibacter oralis]|uniref:HMP/thiamine import ATP-binding protein YkoD n=1 Tax=Methanobrevibacter oralis TaxID=66851 RepID=A0A162FII8_METOA|nr:energy-coupling factor transporter ATPase [Methanobrevibacter oralis]KZX10510.1 putative HMP/thiamine import ATP-binding protein YkoD [Methanobrevibacter oralis]
MEPIIDVKNLSFKYFDCDDFALKNINLNVEKGEFIGIIGKSGSGKSTLLHCLTGIIPHEIKGEKSGLVKINNLNTDEHEIVEITNQLGVVFQNPENQLFNISVEDELAFICENLAYPVDTIRESVDFALDTIGIRHLKDEYPFDLSGGEKQKVAMASVLTVNPKILVLDEPTSELDTKGKEMVFKTLKKLKNDGMTIILVDHNLDEVYKLTDKLVLLDEGKIKMFGKTDNILKSSIVESLGLRLPQSVQMLLKLKSNEILMDNSNVVKLLKEKISNKQFSIQYQDLVNNSVNKVAIKIENLSFKRDGHEILSNINIEIKKGDFVALIGKNGAGKTTLALIIMGILKKNNGVINILGETNINIKKIRKKVGFLFQNPEHQLFCNTVTEEINYGLEKGEDIDKILHKMNLGKLKDNHPLTLSRGERQRVATATALAHNPKILIIDEPTTGQDWNNIKAFMDILRELNNNGKTILIITHDMRVVGEYCKKVILMDDGGIVFNLDTRKAFEKLSTFENYDIKPSVITDISMKAGIKPPLLNVDELIGDRDV